MKKIILGGVVLASLALGLTSCADNDVVVSTPQVEETAYATYEWNAISDVTSYYLSLDGTETNIGKLSVATLTNTVTYEVPTTDLSVGVHKVKFCAAVDDNRSAWSKEFTLIVKETDVTLSMYGDNSFDITTTADVVDLEFKHVDGTTVTARWFNDGESVNIDDLLYNFNVEDNTFSDSSVLKAGTYTVVAKVTEGENVISSNPVVVTVADYVENVTVSLDGANDSLVVNFSEELANVRYNVYYDDELVNENEYQSGLNDSVSVSIDAYKLYEIVNETGKLPTVRVQVLEASNLKNLPADVTADLAYLFPEIAFSFEILASQTPEEIAQYFRTSYSNGVFSVQNDSGLPFLQGVTLTVNGVEQKVTNNNYAYTSNVYLQEGTNNIECIAHLLVLGKTYDVSIYSSVVEANNKLTLSVSKDTLKWTHSSAYSSTYYVVNIYDNGALASTHKVIESELAVFDLIKDLENPTAVVTAYYENDSVYAVSNEVELRTMECEVELGTKFSSNGLLRLTGIAGSSYNYSVSAYNHNTGEYEGTLTINNNLDDYYINLNTLGYGNYDIKVTRSGGNSFLSGSKVFNVEYLPAPTYKVANDKIVLDDPTDLYVLYGSSSYTEVEGSNYFDSETNEFSLLSLLDEDNYSTCTLYKQPVATPEKITLYATRTINLVRQTAPSFGVVNNEYDKVYLNGGTAPTHVYEIKIYDDENKLISSQETDSYSKYYNGSYYYGVDLAALTEDGVYTISAREKGWDNVFASIWRSVTYVKTSDAIKMDISYDYNGYDIDTRVSITSNSTIDNLLRTYYTLTYYRETSGVTLEPEEIYTLAYNNNESNLRYSISLMLPSAYYTNMDTTLSGTFRKTEVDGDIYYSIGALDEKDILLPFISNSNTLGCLVDNYFVTVANDDVITVTLNGTVDNLKFVSDNFRTTSSSYVTIDEVLVPKGVNVKAYLEEHLVFFDTDVEWTFSSEADVTAEVDLTVDIVSKTA